MSSEQGLGSGTSCLAPEGAVPRPTGDGLPGRRCWVGPASGPLPDGEAESPAQPGVWCQNPGGGALSRGVGFYSPWRVGIPPFYR